jgi:hypothetical protein
MFSNIKAKVRKWSGLPYGDLCNLLTWVDRHNVEIDNPNLLVASPVMSMVNLLLT